jgi:phosphomannomutase
LISGYLLRLRWGDRRKNGKADGGIILTASHNPKEWNALKLLDHEGEFISADLGAKVLEKAAHESFFLCDVEKSGTITTNDTYLQRHIDAVVNYPMVNAKAIGKRNFKIVD